ncbi:hypothetical protein [Arenibacter sp. S6351L]|uniref:hypothetical protein n=1 Tax=Arenibacter sp. S6351L TaxID=2926407 RepID=UPI001FF10F8C|nr:hypothetical protein [Arenibacter sp. S6351L]MCK0137433.1 hypothetical protein [Arenibacter sp. S6351L]
MNFNDFFNIPKFDISKFDWPNMRPPELISMEELNEKQITAVNDVLDFLKEQSNIANRQFKTSRNLIWATIFIMILQIGYSYWSSRETNSKQSNLTKIIETQSVQSETISQMSLRLLDLQAQVQTLEKEKQELLKK